MVKNKIDFNTAYGDFPSFEDVSIGDENYSSRYTLALGWCSAAFTLDKLKEIFIEYQVSVNQSVENLDLVPSYRFTAIGKIAFLKSQNVPISEKSNIFFNRSVNRIYNLAKELAEEKNSKDTLIVARSPLLDTYYVGELLEDLIDNQKLLNSSESYDIISKYKTRQGLIKALQERFSQAREEYLKASTDYKEYFEGVSVDDINYRLRCYTRILEDIEAVAHNKKATRKKIQNRIMLDKKVKNVSYCQFDDELKVHSADPTEVVGSKMVLLYNKKRRRITALFAKDDKGLRVKGTTIQDFDEDTSVTKTLRQPERQVMDFRRANRIRRVEVLLDSVSGKSYNASGRLGTDTLILKVINE